MALSNWRRYAANPTVVSLQKDFRNWLNPFPAATGCFIDKTDERKAQKFIKEKWGLVPTDLNYDNYMDFVKTVANISYHNLHEFERFKNNPVLNSANMLEVAGNVNTMESTYNYYENNIVGPSSIIWNFSDFRHKTKNQLAVSNNRIRNMFFS